MYNKSRITFEDSEVIQQELTKVFSPEDIEWRVGSTTGDKKKGLALPYVTNRAIQNRLDEVFTPFGWKNTYEKWHNNSQLCGISVKFIESDNSVQWVTKWDGADNTDYEATKGGLSDSMKRAAVQWGIGRYLYTLPSIWVEIEQRGKTSYIKDSELKRLKDILSKQTGVSVNNGSQGNGKVNNYQGNQTTTQDNKPNTTTEESKPNGKNSNNQESNTENPATIGQKNCLLKNLVKLNLKAEDVEKLSKVEADKLIKSMFNKDESNVKNESQNVGNNEVKQDKAPTVPSNEEGITNSQKGLVNSIIRQVASNHKLNTNVVENKLFTEFNVSSVDELLKSQVTPVVSYLKKLLVVA